MIRLHTQEPGPLVGSIVQHLLHIEHAPDLEGADHDDDQDGDEQSHLNGNGSVLVTNETTHHAVNHK